MLRAQELPPAGRDSEIGRPAIASFSSFSSINYVSARESVLR